MIIGITGFIAAGKETFAKVAMKEDFEYYNLSSVVKKKSKSMKLKASRETHQNLGNFLRKYHGSDFLVKELMKNMDLNSDFIIDGIRNPSEVDFLRNNFDDFILIGVKASQKKRYERNIKRKKKTDPMGFNEFVKIDRVDKGFGQLNYGQQVNKCIELADFVLINNKTKKWFELKAEKVLNKVLK